MKNSQQRFKNQMIKMSSGLLACATLMSAQAQADSANAESFIEAVENGKNLSSFRLRYEHVDQDGITAANGTTLRSLIGWQTAAFNGFNISAQLIDVSKLQDHFNDGVPYSGPIYAYSNQPRNVSYAKIIDPSYTGINQLYVDISAIDNTNIKLGRQQVNLDNVRFIGDIGFRQVMQVFDGISVLNKSIANTDIRLAHYESVRQINTKLRTDGALDIANIKYHFSPTASLTGYGYFSSFDDLGYGKAWLGDDNANQSNRTLGLRLDGASKLNDDWKILYTAEYAKQQDYSGGDKNIDACIGIVISDRETRTDYLYKCADLALYEAKKEGSGTVQIFRPGMLQRLQQAYKDESQH